MKKWPSIAPCGKPDPRIRPQTRHAASACARENCRPRSPRSSQFVSIRYVCVCSLAKSPFLHGIAFGARGPADTQARGPERATGAVYINNDFGNYSQNCTARLHLFLKLFSGFPASHRIGRSCGISGQLERELEDSISFHAIEASWRDVIRGFDCSQF